MSTYKEDNDERKTQDIKIEDETIQQILLLEKEFREHNAFLKNEVHLQNELVGRVWTVSQRYILLESTGHCSRYPDIYASPAEDVLLQEFTDKLQQIRISNCRINSSLNDVRKSCLIFDHLCSQLNMSNESPLINGDAFHRPISYFIELISDLFKYFHAWLLKLKYSSHLLDPIKIDSIEHYKKQLEISEEFEEYLYEGLTYCKCLRPKTKC